MEKGFFGVITRRLLILLIAGVIIGLFHKYDSYVAMALAIAVTLSILRLKRSHISRQRAVLIWSGMLFTGMLGMLAENWGVHNGYWTYHDLSDSRHLPYWLPLAWAIAFSYLYWTEAACIRAFQLTTYRSKLLAAAIISALLPTLGEMVTINLGVWTYSWGWQLLGVPLLAIFLLMLFHLSIYLLFTALCRSMKISDPVFGVLPPRENQ